MTKFLFSILFLLVTGELSFAAEPIKVAILDNPVDYTHSAIQPYIDEGLIKENFIYNSAAGEEVSLEELNREVISRLRKKISNKHYEKQILFLNALRELERVDISEERRAYLKKVRRWGMIKYLVNPRFRSSIKVLGNYLHGTHVAGIITDGLDHSSSKLINFTFGEELAYGSRFSSTKFGLMKALIISLAAKYDDSIIRERIQMKLDSISATLQKENIRVANWSMGLSEAAVYQNSTLLVKLLTNLGLTNFHKKISEIAEQEYHRFMRENPKTIFVVAAGNSGGNLERAGASTSKTEAPNVIKVGSLDRKGELAMYSDYSAKYVDVAAVGTAVKSALVGGGEIHMTGTSMAAPVVTNQLVRLLEYYPDLSAEQLKEIFFRSTGTSEAVYGLVKDSRVLTEEKRIIPRRNVPVGPRLIKR